jgi:hypothetical protein
MVGPDTVENVFYRWDDHRQHKQNALDASKRPSL